MKKFLLLLLAMICLQRAILAQNANPFFASYPTLTPDGETLIYSYNGDLWKSSSIGGTSMRITAMQGIATNPRVSP
ncbi:MAG: hypothetical protein ACTHKY_18015, partial [Ginsengibacter sp.]